MRRLCHSRVVCHRSLISAILFEIEKTVYILKRNLLFECISIVLHFSQWHNRIVPLHNSSFTQCSERRTTSDPFARFRRLNLLKATLNSQQLDIKGLMLNKIMQLLPLDSNNTYFCHNANGECTG